MGYNLGDPGVGVSRGLAILNDSIMNVAQMDRARKQDAVNLEQMAIQRQLQQANLDRAQAEQNAITQAYGGPDYATAMAAKMKEEIQAKKTSDFLGQMRLLKESGASPEFRTNYAKKQLAKIPEYAPMVDSISYMDDEKIEITKPFGEGELPDPTKPGQTLPAGTYTVSGQATGDPKNPYKFTTIKPFTEKNAEETWGDPYEASIGGKKALVQKSSRGQIRPVIQDKSTTVVVDGSGGNPVQQSVFVDPETGKPLVFDKKTGSYRVADVAGSGVAPRPVNPSAGEREKTAAFATLKEQVERIKNTYKPDYVGIVSGRAGALTQLADPNEAAFRQVINDVKDSLLRARSGAQINEQEYARLAKLVPSFNDSERQFEGKMRSFETTLDTLISQREKAQRQGGVVKRGNSGGNKVDSLRNKYGIGK